MPRDPVALTIELLGHAPDAVEPLVVWPERATHRVTVGEWRYVVKSDDEHHVVAREVHGQRRAAAAGVHVPEIVAVSEDAFAMRWIEGVPLGATNSAEAWEHAGSQVRLAHDLGAAAPFGFGFGGYEPAHPTWRTFVESLAERELVYCERELGFPSGAAAHVREALRAAAPLLDAPNLGWCHGDFQGEHVLVDPATDRVASIIDWADHGSGDVGWDVMVVTMDHHAQLDPFLAGYGASDGVRRALDQLLPILTLVRLIGDAHWFAEHSFPVGESLRRAIDLAAVSGDG